MNNKKEIEREELHKTIWKIANELRGSVDGWDFKQYVLGLLFYRFISENIENYVNENQRKAGITDFQYRNISDEEALLGKSQILDEKGFFILPSELFCNIRKGADKNENLNVVISNVFNNIESSARGTASEDDVKGLFDDFTIDNKLGNTVDERNEKLVKLLNAIGDLNFGDYEDNNIDLFGDAYEFLMTMYASSAGKSGGEFFTPQEVGELLARIVIMDKTSVNKVYDPAGVLAPSSKADLAFTMHMLSWLSPKGTAAIVEFPGVLYRGGAEQKIRQYMIDNNFVDTIIQLPSGLFFGTSIATCIIVLKKNKSDNNILFIDASKECVPNSNKMKNGTNTNKLSDENINNIVGLLKDRKSVENKSYLATHDEIKDNDYNISVNSYLKTNTEDKKIDINEVNRKLAEIVPRQQQIREELEEIIKELEVDYHE